eukprot:TRINITY_DN12327_c0_g1_i3.p1 TRINITY_DN12327_c0_g1~~TRINITY_DN12327_c0_g1_i3.p1  ORF type:complete len:788 (-),score=112.36 TRINITY_DN12327_c0_g1_i3:67-2226(-)
MAFVEKGCFQALTAVIIVVNVITVVMELDQPTWEHTFFYLDCLLLSFYMFELVCRMWHFGGNFFCGELWRALLNVLDVVVVLGGILDTWVLPHLLPKTHRRSFWKPAWATLRLLRLMRVFKIFRILLESDLTWTEKPPFQTFIGVVIAINSVLMGLETDYEWNGWFYLEHIFLAIYLFELTLRLKRLGWFFFSCRSADIIWNLLDFVMISCSAIDVWAMPLVCLLAEPSVGDAEDGGEGPAGLRVRHAMMLMRMLRLMRILRLVKFVQTVRPLYVLVTGVAAAVQGVVWVLVLVFTVIYALGIVSTRLIGHGMIFTHAQSPEVVGPFKSVPESMFTLFRIMSSASSASEQFALERVLQSWPFGRFAFAFFLVTSSWTLLSILTAVVSENMITTTGEQEMERRIISAELDRSNHKSALSCLFQQIDKRADGLLDEAELNAFLDEADNHVKTAKICRVPVRDVRDVLQTLHLYEHPVTVETFVDQLLDVGRPVTEKSMMKLEALLTTGNARLQELSESILQQTKDVAHESRLKIEAMEERVSGIQRSMDALQRHFARFDERSAALAQTVSTTKAKLETHSESLLASIGEVSIGFKSFSFSGDVVVASFRDIARELRLYAAENQVRLEHLLDTKFREHAEVTRIVEGYAANIAKADAGPSHAPSEKLADPTTALAEESVSQLEWKPRALDESLVAPAGPASQPRLSPQNANDTQPVCVRRAA